MAGLLLRKKCVLGFKEKQTVSTDEVSRKCHLAATQLDTAESNKVSPGRVKEVIAP
jgi:hypothetical protein